MSNIVNVDAEFRKFFRLVGVDLQVVVATNQTMRQMTTYLQNLDESFVENVMKPMCGNSQIEVSCGQGGVR